jgi:hypothetical protein
LPTVSQPTSQPTSYQPTTTSIGRTRLDSRQTSTKAFRYEVEIARGTLVGTLANEHWACHDELDRLNKVDYTNQPSKHNEQNGATGSRFHQTTLKDTTNKTEQQVVDYTKQPSKTQQTKRRNR